MKNRTVLFVDDDRITLRALEHAMLDEPHRSLFVLSGSQALDIMASEAVAVVVTDLIMPEMDGLLLLDRIQANYPETVRVVLSTLSDTTSILQTINDGSVYRYIVKPWKREELKITVRQALELFEIQQEKKQLINQLERNNRILEQRVIQRAQQLLDINSQAEIGKHVSQIVHNLNNPLQAIFGNVDLAELMLSKDVPDLEKITQILGRINKGALDLEKIVRSILLHTRSNAIYESSEVDINSIVLSELEFFKVNPVFKQEIEKRIDLVEPAPIIFGNPVQIKQIVDNLITNAIDAMAACSPKRLSVATRVQSNYVELSITDTGEGIDVGDITKIFSPDFTTKPLGKGTGLGLASVKTMVDAYNGSISVESQKGQGATFSVRLPVAAGPGVPAA